MGIWISIGNPAYYGDYIPQERQEHTLLAAFFLEANLENLERKKQQLWFASNHVNI